MERYRRGKGKRRLLGSHQKCWLWGRNAVVEAIRGELWPIVELHISDDLPADEREMVCRAAARLGISPAIVPDSEIVKLCHTAEHQGYLAKMAEYPYAEWSETLVALRALPNPLALALDAVQDPYNFGAILRSAEVFGVDAVLIGANGQVGVTSMVARSSAGAVNRVTIARVADLPRALCAMRDAGMAIIGASEHAESTIENIDFGCGLALVIGSEGSGLSPAVQKECGGFARIRQHGSIGSLNAAIAASIILYEIRRQRAHKSRMK